jgi:hypothetical protein
MLPLKALFILSIMCFISACSSEEEIRGCMDPTAVNFDSSATINDGSCTFLRDEYIGSYDVQLSSCDKTAFFSNLKVVINPDGSNSSDVGIVVNNVYVRALIFKGSVSNSGISINSSYEAGASRAEEAFDYNGTLYFFPRFTLLGNVSKTDGKLSGQLTLSAVNFDANDAAIFSIRCQYNMTKT